MTRIKSHYDTLSYGQYPDTVESILGRVGVSNKDKVTEAFDSEFGSGLLESKGRAVIERVASQTPPKAKQQLLGTLGTLLHYRDVHQMKIGGPKRNDPQLRFDVSTLSDGASVFLLHPGYKAFQYSYLGPFPMDVAVNVEGWENPKGNTTPLHKEVFSDLYWKFKEAKLVRDNPAMADALISAISDLQQGVYPDQVLGSYAPELDFSVGNMLEPLFHVVFWIFIQEDLNYAEYGGRTTPFEIIEDVYELPVSSVDTTNEVFPNRVTESNHGAYYGIIDGVKGYDREDGELLPLSEIRQQRISID